MYDKEVVEQSAKIEKMKAENKDEHDIKKQVNSFCIVVVCGIQLRTVLLHTCQYSVVSIFKFFLVFS